MLIFDERISHDCCQPSAVELCIERNKCPTEWAGEIVQSGCPHYQFLTVVALATFRPSSDNYLSGSTNTVNAQDGGLTEVKTFPIVMHRRLVIELSTPIGTQTITLDNGKPPAARAPKDRRWRTTRASPNRPENV